MSTSTPRWLNAEERKPAREAVKKGGGFGPGGLGPKGGVGMKGGETGPPGAAVSPADVKKYPAAKL